MKNKKEKQNKQKKTIFSTRESTEAYIQNQDSQA